MGGPGRGGLWVVRNNCLRLKSYYLRSKVKISSMEASVIVIRLRKIKQGEMDRKRVENGICTFAFSPKL